MAEDKENITDSVTYGSNKVWLIGVLCIAVALGSIPFVYKSWALSIDFPFVLLILGFFVLWLERVFAFKSAYAIEYRLRDLFNISPEGILLLDRRKCISWLNPAAEQVLTRDRAELLGKHIRQFFPDTNFDEMAKKMLSMENRSFATTMSELVCLDKDKKKFLVHAGVIVRGPLGRPLYSLVIRDFSAQERAALDNEFLKAMGLVATGLSNEIADPLQYIYNTLVYLQTRFESLIRFSESVTNWLFSLQTVPIPEDLRRDDRICRDLVADVPGALRDAIDASGSTAMLVRTAYSFVRRTGDELRQFDLNKLIEEIVSVSKGHWKESATVDLNLDRELPLLRSYIDMIKYVIFSLVIHASKSISNARKSALDKPGTIAIATQFQNAHVYISIGESGDGDWSAYFRDGLFLESSVGTADGKEISFARNLIATKLKGSVYFEKQIGKLSVIKIELPLEV